MYSSSICAQYDRSCNKRTRFALRDVLVVITWQQAKLPQRGTQPGKTRQTSHGTVQKIVETEVLKRGVVTLKGGN